MFYTGFTTQSRQGDILIDLQACKTYCSPTPLHLPVGQYHWSLKSRQWSSSNTPPCRSEIWLLQREAVDPRILTTHVAEARCYKEEHLWKSFFIPKGFWSALWITASRYSRQITAFEKIWRMSLKCWLSGNVCATISLGLILPWSEDELLSLKNSKLRIQNESFRVEYEGIRLPSHSIYFECESANS